MTNKYWLILLLLCSCAKNQQHKPSPEPTRVKIIQSCASLSSLPASEASIFYQVGSVSVNLPKGQSCRFADGTVVSNQRVP